MLQIIKEEGISLPSFIWIGAWIIHVIMSVCWVQNVRLPRFWPALGALFGSASFLLWAFVSPESPRMEEAAIIAMGVQVIVVFPSVVLALWLMRFHWGRRYDE